MVSPLSLLSCLALVQLCAWRGIFSAMSRREISGSCCFGGRGIPVLTGETWGTDIKGFLLHLLKQLLFLSKVLLLLSEVTMGRGPSYPYVDLEGAIGYARKLYDYAKRGSAPVESIVKEGFRASLRVAAHRRWLPHFGASGLVEDAPGTNGKALKLSSRAIRILLDDQDSAERQRKSKRPRSAQGGMDTAGQNGETKCRQRCARTS